MTAKIEKSIPYKIYLSEEEMPKAWYNLRSDMKVKPAPLLNPGTGKPMTAEELSAVFCEELVQQELDDDVSSGAAGSSLLFGAKAGYAGKNLL